MAMVYMIGSFKGGVGKSVSTINLAYSLAEMDSVLSVIEEKPAPKPIKLSVGIREKYFQDTDPKEVEAIIGKALAAWFKKKR